MLGAYASTGAIKSDGDAKAMAANCANLGVASIMLLMDKREIEARLKGAQGFDAHAAVCVAAKAAGIQVHAWLCLYREVIQNCTDIVQQHPEYLVVNRQRKSNIEQPTWSTLPGDVAVYWVCASAEGYRDYLAGLMTGIIDRYDVDGIHLDYVRYPEEVEGRAYCYCERCLGQFKEKYGYELPAQDVIKNRYYVNIMCENVSRSVEHFANLVHGRGKEISAYVLTDYLTAIETCYQDWPWFSRFLDRLIITVYEVQDAWVRRLVERARAVMHEKCRLATAAYTFPGNRRSSDGGSRWWTGKDEEILAAMRATYDAGADGVYLFTYEALFDPALAPERRELLVQGIRRIAR